MSGGAPDLAEYLSGAHDVMKHGYEVEYLYKPSGVSEPELRTGFVRFMGNAQKGPSKFEFVGTNVRGEITTYHVKSGKEFWKTLNGNPQDKVIRPINHQLDIEHTIFPKF